MDHHVGGYHPPSTSPRFDWLYEQYPEADRLNNPVLRRFTWSMAIGLTDPSVFEHLLSLPKDVEPTTTTLDWSALNEKASKPAELTRREQKNSKPLPKPLPKLPAKTTWKPGDDLPEGFPGRVVTRPANHYVPKRGEPWQAQFNSSYRIDDPDEDDDDEDEDDSRNTEAKGSGKAAGKPKTAAQRKQEAFRFLNREDVEAMAEPEWLVWRLVPKVGTGQVHGPSNVGKTFVVMDLALSIAGDEPAWHGYAIEKHGPVIYLALEDEGDWKVRVHGWEKAHPGCDASNLVTAFADDGVDLASSTAVDEWAKAMGPHSPVMIVVDTQARATPGTEENSNRDMGVVMDNLRQLSNRLQCFVMTVHHTGWS